jgi:hypothetical protein
VFVVLVSVLVSAGDLLRISTTFAEVNYDSGLDHLLKTCDDPVIIRGFTYNAYFSELQNSKLFAAYSDGSAEVYEMFNDQTAKMFGYASVIPILGVWRVTIYFDRGIPKEVVNLIGKPIKYEDY